jgi:MSHA biogenesis protein MshJ
MQARLLQWLNRFEALSLREQLMALVGLPLALLAAGEFLVFDPARKQAVEARKQAERMEGEVKALGDVLAAAQPTAAPLPAADQLQRERNELQQRIDAADAVVASIEQTVDWGAVVRATAAGTPGLTLTQLKTMPAEVVFSPSMIKPAAPPAAGRSPGAARAAASASRGVAATPAPAARPVGRIQTIYRHRADLTVTGEFGAVLVYLQALQHVPGDLHWDHLQLGVASYPQASLQLALYTLSTREETPFNGSREAAAWNH